MEFMLVVAVIAALLLGASFYLSNLVIHPRTRSPEYTYAWEKEQGHITASGFESWPKEEVRLMSPYGYALYGLYVPVPNSRKIVILAHGITWTLYGSVKYATLFYKRGWNVLLYDHRNHGRSGGHDTSFGVYEKEDLKAWVDWALMRCGAACVVGTHGESLGGATVLQHAAIDPRIAFVVADCPFASAWEQFAYRLRVEYHLPAWPLLPLASLITRLRAGWSFAAASPIATIAKVQTPVLFIHGAEDDYVPPSASVRMFERKPGVKRLYLVPGAAHARALMTDPEAYDRELGAFLAEIGLEEAAPAARSDAHASA